MKRPNILWAAPLALATAGLVIFLPTMNAAKAAAAPDSERVLKLLSDAKTTAFQLKEDAEAMESFTRVNVTWECHAKAITVIKDHVNELGRIVGKLREARAEASPWQKTAIDRIVPFLDELEANVDYSADMAAIISDFVNFGKTKARFERLSDKLELPASR